MENLIGIDNNILVNWTLLRTSGKPFPVDGLYLRIFVSTPRGRDEIRNFSISGENNNIVSWEMNNGTLRFLGQASLTMSILREGLQIATVEAKNAFSVSRRSPRRCDCTQKVNLTSFVNVLHEETAGGTVNVLFPTFELGDDMHLYLKGTTEQYSHSFELGADGHLRYTNND